MINNIYKIAIALIIITITFIALSFHQAEDYKTNNINSNMNNTINLPEPKKESTVSVEEAIESRRSVRSFLDEETSLEELSQILWSAQGITSDDSKKASPSAGATYPLNIYVTVRKVHGVSPGVYRYNEKDNTLKVIIEGDISQDLANASLGQSSVSEASFNVIITGVYERTTARYGERGERYVHIEVGHVGQNIYLQCESLNLGTVAVGAFNDGDVIRALNLKEEETPLYIMPVGKIK